MQLNYVSGLALIDDDKQRMKMRLFAKEYSSSCATKCVFFFKASAIQLWDVSHTATQ